MYHLFQRKARHYGARLYLVKLRVFFYRHTNWQLLLVRRDRGVGQEVSLIVPLSENILNDTGNSARCKFGSQNGIGGDGGKEGGLVAWPRHGHGAQIITVLSPPRFVRISRSSLTLPYNFQQIELCTNRMLDYQVKSLKYTDVYTLIIKWELGRRRAWWAKFVYAGITISSLNAI